MHVTIPGFAQKLGKKIPWLSIQFQDLKIDKRTGENNEWNALLAERFDVWHKVS